MPESPGRQIDSAASMSADVDRHIRTALLTSGMSPGDAELAGASLGSLWLYMRQIIDGIEMLAAADATGDLARDAARSAEMVQEAMMTLGAWFPELVRELPRSIQRTGAVGQQFEDVWDPPSERAERLDGVDAWFTATDTGNAARAIVDLYDESLELIEQLYLGNFLKDEQGPQVTGAERSRLRRSLMRVHELTGLLEVEGG